jgi:pyruvate dehydrogenase E1 component alpha subunit
MQGEIVDGNDFIEVYKTAKKAIDRAKSGQGPSFIECKTYRRTGHSRGDSNQYRDKEEEKIWLARDPIIIARNKLKELNILDDSIIGQIDMEVKNKIENAIKFAQESPLPEPGDCLKDLWAEPQ